MRAVIQRVNSASVRINNEKISSINEGILVLLGIEKGDFRSDADYILDKTINLRIFEDKQGKMNLSLLDIDGEMMVVSQFTLLGDCTKGRRPSFFRAEEPLTANDLYEYFVGEGAQKVKKLACGKFQEMMQIELVNNGPVTILLDSKKSF
ncbi:MAG: D-tyrosyl-tRNA(Tyr) deacylase [Deltaproteobacteria bacterium HGW-Deltaproteobacteria-12]|jgi:D-tyrosyl-tRNA(Tyr) deacylase|nr:MAG: D-tyrosyl-tRNA(Tyr) deacylase [Deltaproteobacteria bacterium HGW-Deltaproteobacteria-12]